MPMKKSDPDFLQIAQAADQGISTIARELGESEFWVARVLGRQVSCSPGQAARIATLLKLDPECASSLVVPTDPPQSTLAVVVRQVFDKVVIGGLALIVALTVQSEFATFALSRERALAVSTVSSQFLIDRYTQAKTDFVALLVQLESARRLIRDNMNTDQAKAAATGVETLRNRLEVDVNVIASAHPSTKTSVDQFAEALQGVTDALIDRRLSAGYEDRLSLFRTRFFELGSACQDAMVETVEEEWQKVDERRRLW